MGEGELWAFAELCVAPAVKGTPLLEEIELDSFLRWAGPGERAAPDCLLRRALQSSPACQDMRGLHAWPPQAPQDSEKPRTAPPVFGFYPSSPPLPRDSRFQLGQEWGERLLLRLLFMFLETRVVSGLDVREGQAN